MWEWTDNLAQFRFQRVQMKSLGDILMLKVAGHNVGYESTILAKLGAQTQIVCNRTSLTTYFSSSDNYFTSKC